MSICLPSCVSRPLPVLTCTAPYRTGLLAVARCHAAEECCVVLVELLHSTNPAVLLAAAEALIELAKVSVCGGGVCFLACVAVRLADWLAG